MENNYSIDEILSAVEDIQNIKKVKENRPYSMKSAKIENSSIPKNTLKLIEEAENSKN